MSKQNLKKEEQRRMKLEEKKTKAKNIEYS